MRLSELSEASGVSPASIKFYLRSGLLSAGERVNPTRAVYGEQHVRRLRLIQGLRSAVGLSLEDIRRIIDASQGAEHSMPQRLALLATVQSVVLGLGGEQARTSQETDGLIRVLGWPDQASEARDAVNAHLTAMETAGIKVQPVVLQAYGQAADVIADVQLSFTDTRADVEDFILTAAIGMHMHNQLILKIIALAQASHSIRRYGGHPLHDVQGPELPGTAPS